MQTWIVRRIVNLYFVAALILSFTHIMTTGHKLHTTGWQVWFWPFMLDGIAVIGMVMRTDKWSDHTNKVGFRVQMVAGTLSLGANVYAGNTVGDIITGVGAVGLFLFAEWLSDQLETRTEAQAEATLTEAEAIAAAEAARIAACNHRTTCATREQCESKDRAARTRRRNARTRKAQERLLADMVNAG